MLFDLSQTESFDLYRDRASITVSGPCAQTYHNETLILKSSGKRSIADNSESRDSGSPCSFNVNLLTDVGATYSMNLDVLLKDVTGMPHGQKGLLTLHHKLRNDFGNSVSALLITEARKPSKKLLDREIVLKTSKDKAITHEKLELTFVAVSERTLVGMLVHGDDFELILNKLTIKKKETAGLSSMMDKKFSGFIRNYCQGEQTSCQVTHSRHNPK
jgi:hypothetical protein